VHWISYIYVQDQTGHTLFMKTLAPTSPSPAQASFIIPDGVTSLTAYAFCNKHGLYASDSTVFNGVGQTVPSTCNVDLVELDDLRDISSASGQLLAQSIVAEMHRRQLSHFEGSAPFTEEVSLKHTPYVVVDGDDVKVHVGQGVLTNDAANIHPMTPSASLGMVHYINFMYVLDEYDAVVAMTWKSPDDPAPATLQFPTPKASNIVTPYEFCNKHGLYVGPSVILRTTTTTTLAQIPEGTCDFVVAELERRQSAIFGSSIPYTELQSSKHAPYIVIEGTRATVIVGNSVLHPMTASNERPVLRED